MNFRSPVAAISLVLLLACGTARSGDQPAASSPIEPASLIIGYVEQEVPGQPVIVSFTRGRDLAVVSIHDYRGGQRETTRVQIPPSELSLLASLLSSPEVMRYRIENPESANMSDVGFYTFAFGPRGDLENVRIPADTMSGKAAEAVRLVKRFLGN